MDSKGFRVSTLVLRIFALGLLAGSMTVLATDKFSSDGDKTTFKDVHEYSYMMAATLIGFVCTLFQIPFSAYHVVKEKRMIRGLQEFDFYADKVVAFVLASAVGAGFAVSFEFKRMIDGFQDFIESLGIPGVEESESQAEKFRQSKHCDGYPHSRFPLCCSSLISSMSRSTTTTTTGRKGFFG